LFLPKRRSSLFSFGYSSSPAVRADASLILADSDFNGTTSQYDPNGNLASTSDAAGATTYLWDARDRLIGITGPTLTASFQYDALDRRIRKTINGVTTTYQYDGADLLTESGASNASYLSTLNIDEPIVRQTATSPEFYLTNALGSTLALTDDSGTVTTRYTYEPFGATTVNGSSTNPVQFTGREHDAPDLYYYRARYYSPSRSRFLSEDPLEFGAGDENLYAYVFNNPTTYTDPSGEILPALAMLCLRGAAQSIAQDIGLGVLSGRKPEIDWGGAAMGCLTGGLNKATALMKAARKRVPKPKVPGPTVDPATGQPVGRLIGTPNGPPMIEPAGGTTVAGRNGSTHTTYPNGSNYQRWDPNGHGANPTPHGHGHLPGSGPGKAGQGPSIDPLGNVVPSNSPAAHWPFP